jgi:hypothetical protein
MFGLKVRSIHESIVFWGTLIRKNVCVIF